MGPRRAILLLLLALGGFAAWRAASLAWLCDDSFISFRYAQNLVEGHGLVYNPGERVEGYTNLLWTLLLAGGVAVGVAPETAAHWLGVVSYLSLAGVLAAWSWRRSRGAARPFLPLAAALVLALDDFHVWATGGLETLLFATLATAGVLLACSGGASSGRGLVAGSVLGLAVLARPDGILFVLAALLFPWLGAAGAPRARAREMLAVAAPAATIVATLVAFKLGYYGELFPTAFYSKSATRPYYSQGALYLSLWLVKNWVILPAAALAVIVSRSRWPRTRGAWLAAAGSDVVLLGGTAALFLAYVAHSGGDFMFARRLLPAIPLLFLAIEDGLHRWRNERLLRTAAALILVAAVVPYPLYGPGRWRIHGVGDERHFYPADAIAARRRQGELVGAALDGSGARVMIEGGMCSFGYYSRLPYLVEMTGLTQYSLARLPLARRGFIGHEKQADATWLDVHRVHLIMSQSYPQVVPPPGPRRHDEIYFSDLAKARIWTYDDAVMDHLRGRPEVSFVPIEAVLRQLRAEIEQKPEAAGGVFAYLEHYYFRNGGPKAALAEREFRALVASAGDAERRRGETRLRPLPRLTRRVPRW